MKLSWRHVHTENEKHVTDGPYCILSALAPTRGRPLSESKKERLQFSCQRAIEEPLEQAQTLGKEIDESLVEMALTRANAHLCATLPETLTTPLAAMVMFSAQHLKMQLAQILIVGPWKLYRWQQSARQWEMMPPYRHSDLEKQKKLNALARKANPGNDSLPDQEISAGLGQPGLLDFHYYEVEPNALLALSFQEDLTSKWPKNIVPSLAMASQKVAPLTLTLVEWHPPTLWWFSRLRHHLHLVRQHAGHFIKNLFARHLPKIGTLLALGALATYVVTTLLPLSPPNERATPPIEQKIVQPLFPEAEVQKLQGRWSHVYHQLVDLNQQIVQLQKVMQQQHALLQEINQARFLFLERNIKKLKGQQEVWGEQLAQLMLRLEKTQRDLRFLILATNLQTPQHHYQIPSQSPYCGQKYTHRLTMVLYHWLS